LEEELQQSGLLTKRLNSDLLKVNLSSEGLFDFDSAQIKDGTRPALEKLAEVLRKHDNLSIQIVGHTDSSGIAVYNLHLSQLRAKAVADFLVSQDLTGSSIQSEGRGDQDTRLEQSTSNNPVAKRRVEIYIRRAPENRIRFLKSATHQPGSDSGQDYFPPELPAPDHQQEQL
jgi:outer membrane protein OmpA-like peptidoglycan-associated protein